MSLIIALMSLFLSVLGLVRKRNLRGMVIVRTSLETSWKNNCNTTRKETYGNVKQVRVVSFTSALAVQDASEVTLHRKIPFERSRGYLEQAVTA